MPAKTSFNPILACETENDMTYYPSYLNNIIFSDEDYPAICSGNYSDEAIRFFTEMARITPHPGNLHNDLIRHFEKFPGREQILSEPSRMLALTLALIAAKDISLISDYAHHNTQSAPFALAGDWMNTIFEYMDDIDVIEQYKNKGKFSLRAFLSIFKIDEQDLANKIVLDDDLPAFKQMSEEVGRAKPSTLDKAMARVAFTPFSAIRNEYWPEHKISMSEMLERYKHQCQYFSKSGYEEPLDAMSVSTLRPVEGVIAGSFSSPDHKLKFLPLYRELLENLSQECIASLSVNLKGKVDSISSQDTELVQGLIGDLLAAGVRPERLFYRGILSRTEAELFDLTVGNAERSKTAYRENLLDELAKCFSGNGFGLTIRPTASIKLLLAQLYANEPIEEIEKLLNTDIRLRVAYDMTGDKQYLSRMKSDLDEVLSRDLGL
jgi:hypothetical protein